MLFFYRNSTTIAITSLYMLYNYTLLSFINSYSELTHIWLLRREAMATAGNRTPDLLIKVTGYDAFTNYRLYKPPINTTKCI